MNEEMSNDIKEKHHNGNTEKSEENPKEKIPTLIFTKSIIRKKSEDQVKQSDGTNDLENNSVKHRIKCCC